MTKDDASSGDRLVAGYLARLATALGRTGMTPERREEISEEISLHIADSRRLTGAAGEEATRALLERMGEPEEVAGEAAVSTAPPARARSRRRLLVEAAAAVVGLGTIAGLATTLATSASAPASQVALPCFRSLTVTPRDAPPASRPPSGQQSRQSNVVVGESWRRVGVVASARCRNSASIVIRSSPPRQ